MAIEVTPGPATGGKP
jgi:hypothetical protein